ncbi:MAG: hypothetical protein NZ534_01390 [Bacteroidia bacterium]|nr:hypothetical protein [Bacteroidia bacterium]
MDALVRLFDPPSLFFTSGVFAVCFGLFYVLYAAIGQGAGRAALGTAASLGFYAHFAGSMVVLPVAVATSDFCAARLMHALRNPTARRLTLLAALSVDLGLLGYFKYADFLTQIFLGRDAFQILAPVGISFFVFKSLSYVFDVYYETIEKPEKNYLFYLYFVSFFPTVLAGPIHRASTFLEECRKTVQPTSSDVARFGALFVVGLFKKTVVADTLSANFIARVFSEPERYSPIENWFATAFYGLYLFNDFSGYSDMATALAGLLGHRLPANFNEPFKAASVSEFWRRWHISLSQWFGDYVFKPLSFAWKSAGNWGAAAAAVATFALSGLWHGAQWSFVLWGSAHGLAVGYETVTARRRRRWSKKTAFRALGHLATLVFLLSTYPLFAAGDLQRAFAVYEKIFSPLEWESAVGWWNAYATAVVPYVAAALVAHFLPTALKNRIWKGVERIPWPAVAVAAAIMIVIAWQLRTSEALPVVYLKF